MNKLVIIGNLTSDPESGTTQSGVARTVFRVAVNRRGQNQEPDFFRVTAWRTVAENCAKYLAKGRKVCVMGPVSVSAYTTKDGKPGASLEVTAEDVEFLTPKSGGGNAKEEPRDEKPVEVTPDDDDELPF